MEDRRIKIAIAQLKSKDRDREYNLRRAVQFIEEAAGKGADIICFPEMFYTGYELTNEEIAELAEPQDGALFQKLSGMAIEKKIHIVMSYPEKEASTGKYYVSSMLVDDDGRLALNHRKTYQWGDEKKKFATGGSYDICETKLGKIGLLICYEMEFPEPARILAFKGAEMIFFSSFFNTVRNMRKYLSALAIQNQVYIGGANQIDLMYEPRRGGSLVCNQLGQIIAEASTDSEELLITEINLTKDNVRDVAPHMRDFNIETLSILADAAKQMVK